MLFITLKPLTTLVLRTSEMTSQKALCKLLVSGDGLTVTSIFVTSLVRFANISKHLVFQGRISLRLLFPLSWVCGEDVKLESDMISMAAHISFHGNIISQTTLQLYYSVKQKEKPDCWCRLWSRLKLKRGGREETWKEIGWDNDFLQFVLLKLLLQGKHTI